MIGSQLPRKAAELSAKRPVLSLTSPRLKSSAMRNFAKSEQLSSCAEPFQLKGPWEMATFQERHLRTSGCKAVIVSPTSHGEPSVESAKDERCDALLL